jgi:hypothetical protein
VHHLSVVALYWTLFGWISIRQDTFGWISIRQDTFGWISIRQDTFGWPCPKIAFEFADKRVARCLLGWASQNCSVASRKLELGR